MIASAVLDGVKGQLPSPPHTPHFATTPSSVRSSRSNARGNLRALKGLKRPRFNAETRDLRGGTEESSNFYPSALRLLAPPLV